MKNFIHERLLRAKRAREIKRYEKIMKSMMDPESWCIDTVNVMDDILEIRGWALAPQGDHSRVSFRINGREFEQVHFPATRNDLGELFWYIPWAKDSGFSCRINISQEVVFPKGYAVISYVDRATGKPLNNERNYYFYDVLEDRTVPIPDVERRARVHGNDSENLFLLEGFSTYMKLELALQKTVNKGFDDFKNILDWGCGCGRLTRYFRDIKSASITGIDIDSDNIHWCKQHLPFGYFLDIPLHPPTPLQDSSFDLLIGISIFTHLREREQFDWLGELKRIASKGALLLMTIHGNTNICMSGLNSDLYSSLNEKGLLDAGPDPNLDSVLKGNDYYRYTIHTRKYVMENWSKYFEILDIIPGYIGNHHDLVIMRKD